MPVIQIQLSAILQGELIVGGENKARRHPLHLGAETHLQDGTKER